MRKRTNYPQLRYQSAIDELTFWEDYARAFPPGSARSRARLKEAMDAARQRVSEANAAMSVDVEPKTLH